MNTTITLAALATVLTTLVAPESAVVALTLVGYALALTLPVAAFLGGVTLTGHIVTALDARTAN